MSFLFDEHISPRLAEALRKLGQPADHVVEIESLGRGAKDHRILPYCAKHDLSLVTLDRRMLKNPHLYSLIREQGVSAFFVYSGRKETPTPWEIFEILVRYWRDMCRIHDSEKAPLTKLVKPGGGVKTWGRRAIFRAVR